MSADGNVYALVNEFMQLRELVKGGQIKADVLELWLEDKLKKMEKGTLAKMPLYNKTPLNTAVTKQPQSWCYVEELS